MHGTRRQAPHARIAWENRARVLSPAGQPEKVKRFIRLARAQAHRTYTVPAAAARLEVSRRTLYRVILEALGCPPGTVIDLVRVVEVAREMTRSRRSLRAIAKQYGFSDQATMGREFVRFTGIPPGMYRAAVLRAKTERQNPPPRIDPESPSIPDLTC